MNDVAVVMGSISDLKIMQNTLDVLKELQVSYEVKVISAHRMPQEMLNFANNAENNGFKVIVAGAGGAAHLPGMIASSTSLPVIGVPVPSKYLKGMDSLLSIVQMPAGVPVATVSIGEAGAKNAAILATKICALNNRQYAISLEDYVQAMHDQSLESGKNLE
ncbi:5-(carboxyamino)imidazole ribonucleotide mutase [Companilactobacillus alimentarius]|uniref:N5-carboxyaminoimidazole ribonucleotide mutase n=1 Tax=Companilactobacillus alimentarius DSM 20249 TaxID=1423720 RepID=A0A2K9HMS5_9LACO|nr:5-(carboxyamino)imidazole ribonucleotide mutase [Companilactobacillus alimentarius]AUI71393.1 5-(carboxyamino)imidazole ribonucleotide mutase [Companilactobacillus alimentarius DSM 20249]KRK74707.1 phospho ribosylaminoimidazole carboxylase (AIR carboxylase), catalytic subunit [Companilactobacillus alimentarius DSM 20249]MDT6951284.1 5-(carboxyamino)imidazole ribonucleotide mutase [Companilactobacillus alimentarius]GEO44381.1 N5-carboxyaminoimidazole ribonucleotide mutase [Companilactobacillu